MLDPMITTKLYPHQKQALSFLLDREAVHPVVEVLPGEAQPILSLWQRQVDTYNRPIGWLSIVTDLEIRGAQAPVQCRGSILADSMGVGKSIVVISLVAATLDIAKEWAKAKLEKDYLDARFEELVLDKTKKKPTVEEFSSPIYGIDPSLANAMTGGFSVIRPPVATNTTKKKQAKEKREKKREDSLSIRFNRLVVRTRATLIVCPLSTVQNWESQIEEHVNKPNAKKSFTIDSKGEMIATGEEEEVDKSKGLSVYIYHGVNRTTNPIELANYDVVITTFSTLGTEFSKQTRAEEEREAAEEKSDDDDIVLYNSDGTIIKKLDAPPEPETNKRKRKKIEGDGASPLQQVQWFRVVLDEAQYVFFSLL